MNDFAELESKATDVSAEFVSMNPFEFHDFLHEKRKEPSLKIHYELKGEPREEGLMLRLKAFLESGSKYQQKRFATVAATEEEYNKHGNAFASGVKWEKI